MQCVCTLLYYTLCLSAVFTIYAMYVHLHIYVPLCIILCTGSRYVFCIFVHYLYDRYICIFSLLPLHLCNSLHSVSGPRDTVSYLMMMVVWGLHNIGLRFAPDISCCVNCTKLRILFGFSHSSKTCSIIWASRLESETSLCPLKNCINQFFSK